MAQQQPTIVFTRNPAATAGAAALLDYTTKEGQALYKEATTPLVNKFDGEPMKLKLIFLRIKDKATQYAWMPMSTHLVNNCACNLCDNYGEIT